VLIATICLFLAITYHGTIQRLNKLSAYSHDIFTKQKIKGERIFCQEKKTTKNYFGRNISLFRCSDFSFFASFSSHLLKKPCTLNDRKSATKEMAKWIPMNGAVLQVGQAFCEPGSRLTLS
jgi:hypothetical protein